MIDYVIKSSIIIRLEKITFVYLDGSRNAVEKIGDPKLGLELSEGWNGTYV